MKTVKNVCLSKQCGQNQKKCSILPLIQELCYSKFKLDIEFNEVVNLTVNTGFTRIAPLKNTDRSFGRFYFLVTPLSMQLYVKK